MDLKSNYKNFGIEGKAHFSESISGLPIKKNYDHCVVCSSWDNRCLTLTESELYDVNEITLIIFDNKDDNGKRDKNDSELLRWANQNFNKKNFINGKSVDVVTCFSKLADLLLKSYLNLGRPLNVLFDLSTCPRYIPLSTVARGFDLGFIKYIDFTYRECIYPTSEKGIVSGEEEIKFTKGQWSTIPISGLGSNASLSARTEYIVSLGFEGNKTLQVINKADPDSVKVLAPNPGFVKDYNSRVIDDNAELLSMFSIEPKHHVNSTAGDAIEAWSKIDNYRNESDSDNNYVYLCAGTKAHSLALTLSALCSDNTSVLYNLPLEHNYVDISMTNKYWLYSIVNYAIPT